MRRRTDPAKRGYVRTLLSTGLACLTLALSSTPASATQNFMRDVTVDTSATPRHSTASAGESGGHITVESAAGGTVTINPLDFFRRINPEKVKTLKGFLRGEADKWDVEPHYQSYVEPFEGRFYYVKNAFPNDKQYEYERFRWDGQVIGLERDTGWPDDPKIPGAGPDSYDARDGLRTYAKTFGQGDGTDVYYHDIHLTGWNGHRPGYDADKDGDHDDDDNCKYALDSDSPYNNPYTEEMHLKYYPEAVADPNNAENNFGGDLGVKEAISITQWHINPNLPDGDPNKKFPVERFWYAKGYGFVEWNNLLSEDPNNPNDPKKDDRDVRWNRWRDGAVAEPERPWEPDTNFCPPFMDNDPRPKLADVAEYFFVDSSDGKLVAGPPTDWVAGETRTYRVKVKNMGAQGWVADGTNPVRLGVHFGTDSDIPGDGWATNQVFRPGDVDSGKSAEVTVTVTAPSQPGTYTLRHRLVRGDNQWFDEIHKTTVEVRPGLDRASAGSNGYSAQSSLSANGRQVAFTSAASNLLGEMGDLPDGNNDVFVRRYPPLAPPLMERASVVSDKPGWGGDCPSSEPSISANGRRVAFTSAANNLVSGDTNRERDVFVRDFDSHMTKRISVGTGNVEARGGGSYAPKISADGKWVAFVSDATNLVSDDTNWVSDVFVHNVDDGTTERVSVATNGAQADGASSQPSISANGEWVAFTSQATNLGQDSDTNGQMDVFVRHRHATDGWTKRVSVKSDGAQATVGGYQPSISANGERVAFTSGDFLVPEDNNGKKDVYVRDLTANTTSRVSVATSGEQSDGVSSQPSISADGNRIAFTSTATNLLGQNSDTNGKADVYVRDLTNKRTLQASVGHDGQANGDSSNPSLSGDGHSVGFESWATNLVTDDTNNTSDVFIARLP
jgi:Tol biopolymer transport system component